MMKPEGWNDAKEFESIPGPSIPSMVGFWLKNVLTGKKVVDPFIIFKKLHEEYGDIVVMEQLMGKQALLFIFDQNEAEKMIRNEGKWPYRDNLFCLKHFRTVVRKDIFGDFKGVMDSQGEEWYNVRSKVNNIFLQPRVVKNYVGSMDEVASDFIEKIRHFSRINQQNEMPENFSDQINRWAFESIGIVVLDKRLGCLDENASHNKMVHYMVETIKLMAVLDFSPLGRFYIRHNLSPWKRFVEYLNYFTEMTAKFLDEAEEKLKLKEGTDFEHSVVEKMLLIDRRIALVMTLDMLSAGIDTVAKLMCSVLYFLAINEDVQEKLRKEIMGVMPSRDTKMTHEILSNVPYLKAIIKEAGRFSPIVSGHMRRTTKDLVLCGYQIPAGVGITIPNLYLSLNENNYHRPKEFIPERWLRTTIGKLSYKNVHPMTTMPFGYGPRSCIGKRFADLELEILTAKIIRNFVLEWPGNEATFGQHLIYGITDPMVLRMIEIPK